METHSALPRSPDARRLSVLSFNIRYGDADDGPNSWPHRRHAVVEVLRRADADVAGLQEALRFQLDEIRSAFPGYGAIGAGRDDGASAGEHTAILYRSDRLRVLESGTFWFSETPGVPGSRHWSNDVPRIATWARFAEPALGGTFLVYNVHLDNRSLRSRERSVVLLAKRLRERARLEPVILMGDFNAPEETDPVRYLRGNARSPSPDLLVAPEPPRLSDSFRAVHPHAEDVATRHDWTGSRKGPRIDYIFVSPEIETLAAEVLANAIDGRYPSDHYPICATIRLPA